MKGFDKVKGKITLIQILLVFVIVICLVTYIGERSEKNKDIKKSEELKTEEIVDSGISDDSNADIKPDNVAKVNELKERNDDTVGWIKINDTAIDYPVLHNTQSNAYYLHRNIDKEYSSSGIPFLDYQCKADLSDDNTIIYGHNMRNGTMFHDL